jgi:arabinose-5-phosphate isomerase
MQDVMITGCKTVQPEILAAEALHIMEQHKINALLVVDGKNRVVGALNIHDLFRAGVV